MATDQFIKLEYLSKFSWIVTLFFIVGTLVYL